MFPRLTDPASFDYAARWGARGHVADLDGPVHWIEFGPARPDHAGKPPIVFVHGLGGSHLNWCLLGPELAARRRAVALDLPGFGLTPRTSRAATVQASARLLNRFITEVAGSPVILVGNSMGGMISVLATVSQPSAVAAVVLIDPALPPPPRQPNWAVTLQFLLLLVPGLGEQVVTRVMSGVRPAAAVQRTLRLCFADPSRADPELIKAEVALSTARRPATPADAAASARVFLAAARSMLHVLRRRRRYAAMMAAIGVPVLLLGGDRDRLVPPAAARQAAARNPHWDFTVFPGVGHTPQLEVPGQVAAAIGDWLDRRDL